MGEGKKKISSAENPGKALVNIDYVLKSAYQAPQKFAFSTNESEKTIQKAVLYHRIRQNESLSTGKKSAENDAMYNRLAKDITEGRDPVVNFIKSRPEQEQGELLVELMTGDRSRAWFEDMITRAEEKNAEAAKGDVSLYKDNVQKTSEVRIAKESCLAQSKLFRSLAENRGIDTKQFFAKKGNIANVKRLLATELHRRQIDNEYKNLQKIYAYEDGNAKAELTKQRQPFSFEKKAAENFEEHIRKLENSQEVFSVLHRMTQCSNLEELSKLIINPPGPQYFRQHDNLNLMEQKLIPDAVRAFLSGPDAPEEGSSLDKSFLEFLDEDKQKFPEHPTPEDCSERIKKYRDFIKKVDKTDLADSAEWQKLKEELSGQITRLDDAATAPDREKIKFNFRADTLIDYYDPKDPTHTPMDAMQAREKLIHGEKLEQVTFADDEFMGTIQDVSYDKNTGLINKGPEKLITRFMNLSEKAGKKPELQLEELRKIKEVLKQSDPFYIKNSENYNNVLDSLNKVIKAQSTLDKDANVRQVAELRALYAELDSNAAKYVKDKSDRLKTGDDRAQMRLDAIKTLQSLTGEKHVGKVALELYDEQKKLDTQQKMAEPCMKIMNKWQKAGNPKTPEEYKNFKKDFEALSSRFDMIRKNYGDVPYFKMRVAESLERFTKQAEEVQQQLGPEDKMDAAQMQKMKKLALESDDALKSLYAMDGTIHTEKNEMKQKENAVENNKPEVVKDPLAR